MTTSESSPTRASPPVASRVRFGEGTSSFGIRARISSGGEEAEGSRIQSRRGARMKVASRGGESGGRKVSRRG